MLNKLYELNPFFEISVNNITVLCNLDNAFAFRCSDIMNEFKTLYPEHCIDEIENILVKKYAGTVVKRFLKKLELYHSVLFRENLKSPFFYEKYFTTLTLNVIHTCNMRCKYCFEEIEFRKDTEIMNEEIAIKAIDIFYNQLNGKVGHIIFTGGEPILNFPLIKKIVNYVKQSNYKMTYMIKTNGTLIDEDIMFFLMDNDFDVQISLDGCREANDMNRVYMNQEGSYEDVIKVINKFVENGYKDKLSIHGTVTHQTIQYLRDSLKMMRTEYKGILFEIKEVMGSSESQFLLTNDDQKEYLRCQLDEQISDDFTQGDFLKNRYVCGIGMWHISVDTNGELYPCYRLSGKKEFKMGNVSDGKFVKSKNHKLNEIYNLYKNPNCQKCYSINSCTTGCYADKLLMDEKQLCELSYRNYIEEYLTEYFSDINKVALLPQI